MVAIFFSTPAFASEPIRSVHYSYDLMGRQLTAKFDSAGGTDGVTNTYNGFGELLTARLKMGSFDRTLYSTFDGAGRRTQLKHPENTSTYTFSYCHDALSRLTGVGQGTSCTATPLESFAYGNDGLLSSRTEGAGSSVGYGWDDAGRLTSQTDDFTGTAPSVGWTFAYNPASQITAETRDNDAYAWTGAVAVNRAYAVNGLNQYTSAGPASFTYDANGNLIADGSNAYAYDIENRLVTATSGSYTTTLTYDPLGRLFQVVRKLSSITLSDTRFLYDGDALVLEYNGSGTVTNRYVHGSNAAADDPLVWYAGANLSNVKWLHADHLGSIVAVTDSSGGSPAINAYDEYGLPQMDANQVNNINTGRFQYTGQAWLTELGMYHYKARIYSPKLGRFLQTDPIGYKDNVNLYAYVANDPVNKNDPTGTTCAQVGTQSGGAPKYSCRIDYVSERKNGEWVRRAPTQSENRRFASFNRQYTAAVNRLARNPEASVKVAPVQGNKGAFLSTRGEAAASLISRTFIHVDQDTSQGAALVSSGLPNEQGRVESAETIVTRSGLGASQRDIVHDGGLHSTSQEAAGGLLVPGYPLGTLPHQDQYNRAACTLLGERGDCE